jgi:hypothetical protein
MFDSPIPTFLKRFPALALATSDRIFSASILFEKSKPPLNSKNRLQSG